MLSTAAANSGWLHGNVLSISVLSVVAGIALALAGVVSADPGAQVVVLLVELALVLTFCGALNPAASWPPSWVPWEATAGLPGSPQTRTSRGF